MFVSSTSLYWIAKIIVGRVNQWLYLKDKWSTSLDRRIRKIDSRGTIQEQHTKFIKFRERDRKYNRKEHNFKKHNQIS